ncbi:hypothetical protein [Phosphitispora fastidiosa]|nr:hypothetical protein [Phosphitispora fastidiosa]MBU7006352.1 hypothetical protein [Phosphitispora fastidiosa]
MFKKLLQSIRKFVSEWCENLENRRLQKAKAKQWTKYFRASGNIR